MFRKIWQKILTFIRNLFGKNQTPPPPPAKPKTELPPLTDIEYETQFLETLDGVNRGMGRGYIKAYLTTVNKQHLTAWLQRFGERLLETPENHAEIAGRLLKFGNLCDDEIGQIALKIGQKITGQLPPPPEEEWPVIDAEFRGNGLETGGKNAEVKAWLVRGYDEFRRGEYEEAIESLNQAIAIQPDNYLAFSLRAVSQDKLGRYEEAIESLNQAIAIQPDDHEAFYNRAILQANLGRYEEAIDSYNQAIAIQPDFHEAFYNRGVSQAKLGRYEEAIDSFNQAITIKPDKHEAFYNRGISQNNLGRYEEAIDSYNQAIAIQPDKHEAFNNRGNLQNNLGRYEEAIDSFNQAIAIQPDFHQPFNNRGVSQAKLGRYEEAIDSFNQAIAIQPDFHEAWLMRGQVVGLINRETLLTFTTNIGSNALFYTHYSHLNKAGYEGEIANYQQGIKNCPQDTHPLGWGMLHYAMGIAQFNRGRELQQKTYIHQAKNSYETALQTLTETGYPEEHLKVLQELIPLLLQLQETTQAEKYQLQGLQVLQTLLNQPISSYKKQQLYEKFWSIRQLRVDILIQKNLPIEAIQTAETDKNIYLTWILDTYQETTLSPTWQQMQQMLTETTAIIYWHQSQYSLTTFILKANQPEPILLETTPEIDTLETWIKNWKTEYQNYCNLPKTKQQDTTEEENKNHPWRQQMPEKISQLANLLNIPTLLNHLQNISNLILIPHRDLHNLPLETLFPTPYHLTRLPSLQTGKNLRTPNPNPNHILCIENPTKDLRFAPIESASICRKFPTSKRISEANATANNIIPELQKNHDILHFTCHAGHDFYQPKKSCLYLAENDELTLEQISKIPLETTHLVTLSACETAITKEEIKIDYVGLVSAFLKHRIPYILTTLWRVPEEASMLMMVKFYELRETQPETIALAQAKTWLQNQTWQDIHQFYQSLETELKTEPYRTQKAVEDAINRTSKQPANIQPYANPYYWAAFIINGCHPTA
ncbi:tetratricopeptide repeat protein [Ancylothrix sp. C2]|uniref:CHAT domain-containing protein n=1 Tax=Ancylothrix sp. D3o TaxID=2953691 RepID=UPI0021BB7A8D|nr:tetratricopeptide repeat protein [Ancylothrix sp. D3o]MCT7952449.1 tetratricopeptide repeat protein [Ancylothrix sp. D3o]